MELLSHHLQVVKSKEFSEELRGNIGDKRRPAHEVAVEIVEGLEKQKTYAPMLNNPRTSGTFRSLFSQAIEEYRSGKIKEVGDFQVKRDVICEACGVERCWRKTDDSVSLQEAIEQFRG